MQASTHTSVFSTLKQTYQTENLSLS